MGFEKPEQPKKSPEAEEAQESASDEEQKMTRRQFLGSLAAAGAPAAVEGVSGTAQAEELNFPGQFEVPSTEVFRKYLEQDKVEISDELREELVQEFDNTSLEPLKSMQWQAIRAPDDAKKVTITRDSSGRTHANIEW